MSRVNTYVKLLWITLILFTVQGLFAQSWNAGDSLKEIEVSGTAIVDSNVVHPKYYMDVNGDASAEYRLNFGPFWYEPDSSDASRPESGDAITIYGYVNESLRDSLPVIIVLEINDAFWRDFYEPQWNTGDRPAHHKRHRNSYRNHRGFAFGWLNDSVEVITREGVTMVDSTYHFWHYFLDTDYDTLPDYFLNFGPPWYQPSSGLTHPDPGDTVRITGALLEKSDLPVLFVFELNGEVWIDSTGFRSQMGAAWIHKNMHQRRYIHTPFDSLSGMWIDSGWHHSRGHHHRQMPEQMFAQMLQLFPENVPFQNGNQTFAAFEVGMFNKERRNLMRHNDSVGGMLELASRVQFRFHYNDIQIRGYNRDEREVQLNVWNRLQNRWQVVDSAEIDTETNTVTYSSDEVPGLVVLTAPEATTDVDDEGRINPAAMELYQNYPNPFNPKTTIEFTLDQTETVQLTVYNVLGQQITELLNKKMQSGNHRLTLQAGAWPSGVYFYELKTSSGHSIVKKMVLTK